MKRKKLVIGLIGGSTIASFFLGFVCHKSVGWAGSLSCNTCDPNVKKVDCDNFPSPPCSEYTLPCACGGTTHSSHTNKTGGPCGGQDRIEHTPETHTNYTCEGCDHDFLTVSNVSEECRPIIHLSNPEEHLTTHIEHISKGGHIDYVEDLNEEENEEDDAGTSASGENIEDLDDSGPDTEDSWCLHKNECNFHNSCGHCSYPHIDHCEHNDICEPENDPHCQHTNDKPCVDYPHVSYNG